MSSERFDQLTEEAKAIDKTFPPDKVAEKLKGDEELRDFKARAHRAFWPAGSVDHYSART